jgi:hypothetical protein
MKHVTEHKTTLSVEGENLMLKCSCGFELLIKPGSELNVLLLIKEHKNNASPLDECCRTCKRFTKSESELDYGTCLKPMMGSKSYPKRENKDNWCDQYLSNEERNKLLIPPAETTNE